MEPVVIPVEIAAARTDGAALKEALGPVAYEALRAYAFKHMAVLGWTDAMRALFGMPSKAESKAKRAARAPKEAPASKEAKAA